MTDKRLHLFPLSYIQVMCVCMHVCVKEREIFQACSSHFGGKGLIFKMNDGLNPPNFSIELAGSWHMRVAFKWTDMFNLTIKKTKDSI